jgi:hypothetical protein
VHGITALGGFLDGGLGLLLGADAEDLAALAGGLEEKSAGRLKLGRRLAEINDVNPVAGFEDEVSSSGSNDASGVQNGHPLQAIL